jgi:RNA polymerase sigma-70 factor, ECF subfamily
MMDEQTAIQRLKQGDIGGLESLVYRYQVKALRVANLITRDLPLAEDVVQDCFLHLLRAMHSFDPSRSFEPWFMRSVVNAAVKAAQKTAKKAPVESEADENWFETVLGHGESAEAEAESLAFQREIQNALKKLSPRQRAVIVQRYFLDLGESEMAAEMAVAPGTVKWLLNAARTRLRAILGERSAK